MGKRTTSMFVLVQLQMVMPLLLQEAEAWKVGLERLGRGNQSAMVLDLWLWEK